MSPSKHALQKLIFSEATRAQGDEVAGNENEATEHDVSTAASVDPNSESGALHTVEVGLHLHVYIQ